MSENIAISKFVHIKANTVFVNGEAMVKADEQLPFGDFAKQIYKEKNLNYSKFFKMDSLSKLAFLGASFLFEEVIPHPNTAIILSNNASSLDTDRKHQAAIEDAENYFPSPAVFVYTLPNIAIGEISIKYGLQSENAFFIFDTFNAAFLSQYTTGLMAQEKSEQVVCGWVEVDGEDYEAFMYLVNKEDGWNHDKNELEKLYKLLD
ncbi:3-oxoacyl-ACP synthase [Flavobacteriaceae bacterium F08102]|nr:3-oxoacyl-ACP synthase [Flavobacteriaceae bacterium F08102]